MWNSWPMNDAVFWPKSEGVIGVLGVNPKATATFLKHLTAPEYPKEWIHPRILVDLNPKIPSRGRHLELGETSPASYIKEGILGLLKAGASLTCPI